MRKTRSSQTDFFFVLHQKREKLMLHARFFSFKEAKQKQSTGRGHFCFLCKQERTEDINKQCEPQRWRHKHDVSAIQVVICQADRESETFFPPSKDTQQMWHTAGMSTLDFQPIPHLMVLGIPDMPFPSILFFFWL